MYYICVYDNNNNKSLYKKQIFVLANQCHKIQIVRGVGKKKKRQGSCVLVLGMYPKSLKLTCI